jgi:hypothetical protein
MTPKQHEFIVSLVSEREIPETTQGTYVLNLVAGTAREPDSRQSSAIIEWLLALPRKAAPGAVDVPAGRYALVHPERSIVEFFRVDRPTEGDWAGRTFVNQQASDDLFPVKGARAKAILARIAEDPQAAMIRYGHELGRCGRCGRTLTDTVSRAMGIGPDCADALGIPRISEEEAVALTPPPAAPPTDDEVGAGYERADSPTVSTDKQGVPHAVGGWRARKRYAETLRGEERTVKPAVLTQIEVLPGESWEDIFS